MAAASGVIPAGSARAGQQVLCRARLDPTRSQGGPAVPNR